MPLESGPNKPNSKKATIIKLVQRSFVADTVTPIAAYRAIAAPRASCLLESVESGAQISRYSFIGTDYIAVKNFEASADIIARVRNFVAPFRESMGSAGGALIALAYDAARSFAHLTVRKAAVPPMPDAYVAIPATWLVFDHFSDRLTISAFAEDLAAAQTRARACEEMLLRSAPTVPQAVGLLESVRPSLERERYLKLVERVKKHICAGDVYQLQLGIRFDAALHGEPLDCYRAVRSRNPSPYMFYVDAPFGQLLGASPEFLVRLEGRQARIRPLAGTRPRGNTPNEDSALARELLGNQKERAEHVMLVDLGRNDLSLVCTPGSVSVPELMGIERYSHVMHIVSDVVGELRAEYDALDLLAAGFPAGTVTGTPKVRAMQLIDELEPVARGFYAGSIGRIGFDGDFDSCITLRSMHIAQGHAWWQASAGIVADSEPDGEYREVLDKTRIIREALGAQP